MLPLKRNMSLLLGLALALGCGSTARSAPTPEAPEPIVVTTSSVEILQIVFLPHQATLEPSSFEALDAIAESLNGATDLGRIRIDGHRDASERRDGVALSRRRAETVMKYLIERGVAPERLVPNAVKKVRPAGSRTVSLVVLEL